MRAIIILAFFGILLIPVNASFAKIDAECSQNCIAEKSARDTSCPSSEKNNDQTVQCLRENLDDYDMCINSCPISEPTDTTSAN